MLVHPLKSLQLIISAIIIYANQLTTTARLLLHLQELLLLRALYGKCAIENRWFKKSVLLRNTAITYCNCCKKINQIEVSTQKAKNVDTLSVL